MKSLFALFFLFQVAQANLDSSAKKELAESKKNQAKCSKEFSKYLQDEWEGRFQKAKKNFEKTDIRKGMSNIEKRKAEENVKKKAEKQAGSWTSERSRVDSAVAKFCGGQNWSLGCQVYFKPDPKFGAKCTIYEINKKDRSQKTQKPKYYPADFGL